MTNGVTLQEYLDKQIAFSSRSQKDIATDCGYQPNVITMIKQGRTKLPIAKVYPLAVALGIDPVHLLRLTMNEYQPETWLAVEKIMGFSVSTNEKEIISTLRTMTNNEDSKMKGQDSVEQLELFASTLT